MLKNTSKPAFFIATLFALAFSAQAQYKCNIGGKTSFQDAPCQGEGQKLIITPASGQSTAAPQTSAQRIIQNVKTLETERLRFEKQNELSSLQTQKSNIQRELDRKIKDLQQQQQLANNNLAGATYRQSLSTEMQAITEAAKTKITSLEAAILQTQKDLELQKPNK